MTEVPFNGNYANGFPVWAECLEGVISEAATGGPPCWGGGIEVETLLVGSKCGVRNRWALLRRLKTFVTWREVSGG
jgi:hypothetical protein